MSKKSEDKKLSSEESRVAMGSRNLNQMTQQKIEP